MRGEDGRIEGRREKKIINARKLYEKLSKEKNYRVQGD